MKLKVRNLAGELRSKALKGLEESWGRAGEEKAKKEFEAYMFSVKQDYNLLNKFKETFRREKWVCCLWRPFKSWG